MRDCPWCGCTLTHIGSVGVTIHEAGDTQADRYDCGEGHTLLVVHLEEVTDNPNDQSSAADWRASGPRR